MIRFIVLLRDISVHLVPLGVRLEPRTQKPVNK